jgi:DNA-binding response OmpR family regulator
MNRNAPVLTSTCILIVDDDRGASQALSFMLAARGFDDVRTVRSAARAVAVAEKFRPGIVFIDLDLPEGGGLDLGKRLQHKARQHPLRLIALSTSAEHEKREEARTAGFERYLVKPPAQVELDKILRISPDIAA